MLTIAKQSRLLLTCIIILLSGGAFAQDFSSSITLEEDKSGFCGIDGSVDTHRTGFTGSGFANTDNETGASIDWKINVATSGNYTLTWRYSNISYVTLRPGDLLIDGQRVSTIDFPGTGSWSTWDTISTSVKLTAGTHSISLKAVSGIGLTNIDNLTVSGAGVAPGNCNGEAPPSNTIVTVTFEEDAPGFCNVDGSVSAHRAGFTGTGFADTTNTLGAGIDWDINIPSSGSYVLTWRYSNISNVNLRRAALLVDGRSINTEIDFPGTGSWSTWGTISITVDLPAGQHGLRLQALSGSGLVNIDHMKVRGISPSPGSCGEDISPEKPPVEVTPTPTPIPITSITLQENSAAFCKVDGTVNSSHAGFSGSGYANTDNAVGQGVDWSVNVPASGTYNLTWRYANISNVNMRSAELFVNGNSVLAKIDFPGTGGWATWGTTSVSISLTPGTHILRLEAITALGLVNIDYLRVNGYSPEAGNCDASNPTPPVVSPTPVPPAPTPTPTPPPVVTPSPTPTPTPIVTPTPAPTTMSAVISWRIPTKRENGESLRLGDIGGYEIVYRREGEVLFDSIIIRDPSMSKYVLRNLKSGRYEILIAVFDTKDLYSEFSAPTFVSLKN